MELFLTLKLYFEIETFLTIKLCTHDKMNFLKNNYFHKDGFGVI